MHKLILTAVAAASLASAAANAQGFGGAPPLSSDRVDPRQIIRHDPPAAPSGPVYTPETKKSFSNDDLKRRMDALDAQEAQIRAERQAIQDEAARRAKQ